MSCDARFTIVCGSLALAGIAGQLYIQSRHGLHL